MLFLPVRTRNAAPRILSAAEISKAIGRALPLISKLASPECVLKAEKLMGIAGKTRKSAENPGALLSPEEECFRLQTAYLLYAKAVRLYTQALHRLEPDSPAAMKEIIGLLIDAHGFGADTICKCIDSLDKLPQSGKRSALYMHWEAYAIGTMQEIEALKGIPNSRA